MKQLYRRQHNGIRMTFLLIVNYLRNYHYKMVNHYYLLLHLLIKTVIINMIKNNKTELLIIKMRRKKNQ
jgi:hypothetical protein